MNNLKFSVEQQTAEIDGVQYKLTKVEPEKPKLPTWEELATRISHDQMCIVGFPNRYYNKALTFIRLLEVAEYLNEGWKRNLNDYGYMLGWNEIGFFSSPIQAPDQHIEFISPIAFKDGHIALNAAGIFRANDSEQDLIDFFTK